MCSTDYAPPTVWRLDAVVARKRHLCGECNVDILPSETYARATALTDGEWWGGVRCVGCYFLCGLIETAECNGEGKVPWEGLGEEIVNLLGDYDEATDTESPHWAAVAFEALCGRVFEPGASL